MKVISKAFEQELILTESNRNDVKRAREVLEKALSQQFQTILLALYSSEIIKGRSLRNSELQEIEGICTVLFPENFISKGNENIFEFVSNGIYTKKWPILGLNDLKDIEIRIYNRYVFLWNVIDINEQLAILGSNYRFFFAGAMQIASSYVKKIINFEDQATSIDARFIFGEIGVSTISVGGPVFDFEDELVTSPFFNENVPGFAIGDTAVIRRNVLRKLYPSNDSGILSAYLHEVLHTISYSFKDGAPFSTANWNLYIKRDICRFLKNPHSKKEITDAFWLIINNPIKSYFSTIDTAKEVLKKFDDFSCIFELLLSEGTVAENIGLYICATNQEGQPWDLL